MKYELAKELKDAGFPQDFGELYSTWATCDGTKNDIGEPMLNLWDREHRREECVYLPTLPELLGSFQGRYKYVKGLINDAQVCLRKTLSSNGAMYIAWLDGEWESEEAEMSYCFFEKTPEEALAQLWLRLNKNTT